MNNIEKFKVSSALKNIIGKDLITNKYIAIFELVKNSYDAHANSVDIIFEDNRIIIKDNGKGMDKSDLINKWLFLAYSAKSDNTEDLSYLKNNKNIKSFAGAKGIGRFACDRLGEELSLVTIKDKKGSSIENLSVDWGDFEQDPKAEFINIPVKLASLSLNPYKDIKHGTVLNISKIREDWNNNDIKILTKHLSKLLNPITVGNDNSFNIKIHFNSEITSVENFTFDNIKKITTAINVNFSDDGKYIYTSITDRNEFIYKIKEKNNLHFLAKTQIQLLYLNAPSKAVFNKMTGENVVNFGSVFLYKNGFRVFPYGEEGDDSFMLDRRKGQGYARYLGTRELLGYISIDTPLDAFKESSSRDGGLIQTQEYLSLDNYFKSVVVRRLEAYVIDTLDWTYLAAKNLEINPFERQIEISNLINKLTKSENVISSEVNNKLIEKINNKANSGFKGAIEHLKVLAKESGDKKLNTFVNKINEENKKDKKALEFAETKIKIAENKASSLIRLTSQEFKNIIGYQHQIGNYSYTVDLLINRLIKLIRKYNLDEGEEIVRKIRQENNKILLTSRISTGAGMKDDTNKKVRSLPDFIKRYLSSENSEIFASDININIITTGDDFELSFKPIDFFVILDNLISNSRRARASEVSIKISCSKNEFSLSYEDNGIGLDKDFKNNPDVIFEPKISTTNGSGWGLYHVKDILIKLNGDIRVQVKGSKLKFIITILK